MLRVLLLVSLVACSLGAATRRSPRLDGRIVGGRPVTIEEFPYQVSYEFLNNHMCGGSIISQNWVVTAAQCTDGRHVSNSQIRAGSSFREKSGTIHPAFRIVENPLYNYWNMDFDISVVRVSIPFTYGIGVQPISMTSSEPTTGSLSVVTGWGTLSSGGTYASQLQAVEVGITSRAACNNAYAGYSEITENMICAAVPGGGKDFCSGDTGGPLVVGNELVGIVSWGVGCAEADYPGIYSNVATLKSFVTQVTGVR